jgi:hypothetical protein
MDLTIVEDYIENNLYLTIGATTVGISLFRLLISTLIFGVRYFF